MLTYAVQLAYTLGVKHREWVLIYNINHYKENGLQTLDFKTWNLKRAVLRLAGRLL